MAEPQDPLSSSVLTRMIEQIDHDVRGYLGTIRSSSQVLEMIVENKDALQMVRNIGSTITDVQRLLKLATGFSLMLVSDGPLPDVEDVEIAELVDDVAQKVEGLEVTTTGQPTSARWDRMLVEDALIASGIALTAAAGGGVRMEAIASDDHVDFRLSTGKDLPPNVLRSFADSLERSEKCLPALVITRAVADAHGGRFVAEEDATPPALVLRLPRQI